MNLKKTSNSRIKLVVLSGAGISAESGIPTFRDAGGLWEGYDISEVATPEAWHRNYKLVLEFYNARRRNVASVKPNKAHMLLAQLQDYCEVQIVTQNIDNLHEQAGSKNVLHLHGEITKACSSFAKREVIDIGFNDILDGQKSADGSQLRPFIVWFGEDVPLIQNAAELVAEADVLLIIGTSLEVYPAAGLVYAASSDTPIYVIDPKALKSKLSLSNQVTQIQASATEGMARFTDELIKLLS
jgi:NAD-dependent deacetylase